MNSKSEFIPQVNPLASYLAHKDEIDQAIARTLNQGRYILGNESESFERNFAAYLGGSPVIGTGTGTDALHLAFLCCGIGQDDVVITVSHTAVATAAAIHLSGAIPVFVDIDPQTFTMSPRALEEALPKLKNNFGSRLKAIVAVHLYGNPADMKTLGKIADSCGLYLIEDCAQSHGAAIDGKRTGTWSDIAAFSFYPTKNLSAIGDGGAVVTSNDELAGRAKILREYGWKERYISSDYGMNTRLDEIQAAILNVKLKYLDLENDRRREIASIYDSLLTGLSLTLPDHHSVYHQYVIQLDNRDSLKKYLEERNIGTAIHYPVPIHLQPAYREAAAPDRNRLVNSETVCKRILSLPMYPQLLDSEVQQVGKEIQNWFNRKG